MDASFAERATALQERLEGPPPTTWRPDKPEEGHAALLIGELVAVDQGTTQWGDRKIAVLRDAEGQLWRVWIMHTVLIEEFARQAPEIGDMLAIRYEGRVNGGSGASGYEKYRLVVERAGGRVDWGAAERAELAERAEPVEQRSPRPFAGETEPRRQPEPEFAAEETCGTCGWRNGRHADGCPEDIPF